MTNCFSRSRYVIKTSRRRHFMQIFTNIIFEECPYGLLQKDGRTYHLTARKLEGQLLLVALFILHAKRYYMSTIPTNSTTIAQLDKTNRSLLNVKNCF